MRYKRVSALLVPRDYVSMIVDPEFASCEKWQLASGVYGGFPHPRRTRRYFSIEEVVVNMIDDAGGSIGTDKAGPPI